MSSERSSRTMTIRSVSKWRVAVVALVALGLAAVAGAQKTPSPRGTFTGTVASHEDDELTVVASDGSSMTFRVNDPGMLPATLAVGEKVGVEWKQSETAGAERIAMAVELVEPSSATAADPAPTVTASDDDADDDDGGPSATATAPAPQTEQGRTATASGENSELPHTAGPLVAVLLAGIGALGGGVGLKLRR